MQAQLDAGTRAIVVAGSTGEAATLFDDEYDALLRSAVTYCAGRLPVLAKVHDYVLSRTNVRHRRTVRRVGDATMAQWVRVRFAIDMRRVPAAGSAIHPRAAVDRHSAMPDKAAADHGGRRRGVERGAVAQRCVVASMGVRRSHARLADDLQPVDAADASQRADRPRSGVRHRLS